MRFELLPPVPAVALASQLRRIPLFGFASVDELFRISSIARQVRYEANATVQERGAAAEYIQVLVQGKLQVSRGGRESAVVTPPTLLGFQEVLSGTALEDDATAEVESIALVLQAEEFRTLLSANIEMTQGLFRMLLGSSNGGGLIRPATAPLEHHGRALKTVEKALYLQALPILSHATAEELYAVAGIAREVDLEPGATAFAEGDLPAILVLLSGELEVERELEVEVEREGEGEGDSRAIVAAGACLGLGETLAGTPWPRTGRVSVAGRALRIERTALLDLLSDRLDLLQGIFGAVFRRKDEHGATAR